MPTGWKVILPTGRFAKWLELILSTGVMLKTQYSFCFLIFAKEEICQVVERLLVPTCVYRVTEGCSPSLRSWYIFFLQFLEKRFRSIWPVHTPTWKMDRIQDKPKLCHKYSKILFLPLSLLVVNSFPPFPSHPLSFHYHSFLSSRSFLFLTLKSHLLSFPSSLFWFFPLSFRLFPFFVFSLGFFPFIFFVFSSSPSRVTKVTLLTEVTPVYGIEQNENVDVIRLRKQ